MSQVGPRYRERFSPLPPLNKVVLGVWQIVKLDGSPVTGANPNTVYSHSGSTHGVYERCWDEVHPGPPFNTGGPFTAIKVELPHFDVKGSSTYFSGQYDPWNLNNQIRYIGGFGDPDTNLGGDLTYDKYVNAGLTVHPDFNPSLDSSGAGAFASLRPRLGTADVGVDLAESRDLPRMMKTTAKGFSDIFATLGGSRLNPRMAPKKAADQFLNQQFGWVPFLKSLYKISHTYDNTHKFLAQLRADNNKWVRRHRVTGHTERIDTLYDQPLRAVAPQGYPLNQIFGPGPVRFTVTRELQTHVWAEGVFKYYRPEFDDSMLFHSGTYGRIRQLMTLYGVNINPSVVYAATPWSWLVNWFSNAGSIVDNMSAIAFDGAAAKYVYLMHHHHRLVRFKQLLDFKTGGARSFDFVRSAQIKRRESANSPYGFRLLPSDLTGRQLTILGALGLSRTL